MPVCSTPKTCLTIATLGQTQATTDRGPCTSRRTLKKVTEKHSYIYASGKLLREMITGNGATKILDFRYDQTGAPYSLTYTAGSTSTVYYYVTNLQGDVMYLVDSSGNQVAAYLYDPFGKVLSSSGTMAEINPLRYRGYYQDSETGFYYLQSRYYDPAICRFINADSYASTGQGLVGYNAFAYCLNAPVQFTDENGNLPRNAMMQTLYGDYTPSVIKTAYDQKSGFVNGQAKQPYSKDKFGLSTYENASCADIASYNAMHLTGHPISLGEVTDLYLHEYGTLFGGLGGIAPWQIGRFLRGSGIEYQTFLSGKALEESMHGNDVVIFTVMNDSHDITQGFHTMAARCNGKGFDVYNRQNYDVTSYPTSSLNSVWKGGAFICGFVIKGG